MNPASSAAARSSLIDDNETPPSSSNTLRSGRSSSGIACSSLDTTPSSSRVRSSSPVIPLRPGHASRIAPPSLSTTTNNESALPGPQPLIPISKCRRSSRGNKPSMLASRKGWRKPARMSGKVPRSPSDCPRPLR